MIRQIITLQCTCDLCKNRYNVQVKIPVGESMCSEYQKIPPGWSWSRLDMPKVRAGAYKNLLVCGDCK